MVDQEINRLYESAKTELEKAKEEMSRPSHDVVTYAVCAPTRQAMLEFLKCLYLHYAKQNNSVSDEQLTIDDFIAYCSKYDEEIKQMDFSPLYCQKKDMHDDNEILFCNDIGQVESCNKLAEKIEAVVKKRLSKL